MDDPDEIIGHPINSSIWPHLCGICRSPQSKKCAACKSVAFCGKEHQRKAWPRHKRVCKVFQQCQSVEREGKFIHHGADGMFLNLKHWEAFQMCFPIAADEAAAMKSGIVAGKTKEKDRRDLSIKREIERRQLINTARCLNCGKLPPLPIVCKCKAVAFCSDECQRHCQEDDSGIRMVRHPSMLCKRFSDTAMTLPLLNKEGFSPGLCSQVGKQIDIVLMAEAAESLVHHKSNVLKPDKISRFTPFATWHQYFKDVDFHYSDGADGRGVKIDAFGSEFQIAVADGLSMPMTICYGLERAKIKYAAHGAKKLGRRPLANKDNIFTVHVIGAEADWQGFSAFEEILHRGLFNVSKKKNLESFLPPECEGLRVVMIGPQLVNVTNGQKQNANNFLCGHCSKKKLNFLMEFQVSTYEDFVENCLSKGKSSRPDVLVAFNCGIHDNTSVRGSVATDSLKKRVEEISSKTFDSNLSHAWKPCIEIICQSPKNLFDAVPFILTGFDMFEVNADEEVACSYEKDGYHLQPLVQSEENPFQSPLWQPEPVWHRQEGAPVAFTDNFGLTVLERKKMMNK